jgi:hypothetical protein
VQHTVQPLNIVDENNKYMGERGPPELQFGKPNLPNPEIKVYGFTIPYGRIEDLTILKSSD